ncbi:sensor histidine kinase [Kitasatospora sp. NPDC101183]|uniref:sensor histidine kinase n=1 Tax=Kitasatospora sp. NPDC101183 TaxID=3364100 RepID=UPI00382ECC99
MPRLSPRSRRRRSTVVDSCWAGLLLAAGMLHALRYDGLRMWWLVVCTVLISALLALRRRAPAPVAVAGIALGAAQLQNANPSGSVLIGSLVLAYSSAAYAPRWAYRAELAAILVAGPVSAWPKPPVVVASSVLLSAPLALCWTWGRLIRTRRAYLTELEDRAARLERERDAQAKVAVAAERARIARELHDVVAHNVSVMIVQADGAAYVLDNNPHQAKQSLTAIATTGRQALVEMRRLLGVLRTSDGTGGASKDSTGSYVPQPGVEELPELFDQVRTAGLRVDYTTTGAPHDLPRGVELTVYRIVQEALTNVRKHGGPGVHAHVTVDYGDRELAVQIDDDGRGTTTTDHLTTGGADGLGHGLIGMRERVGMVSGNLETGPRPGGGFRIRATLPLKLP